MRMALNWIDVNNNSMYVLYAFIENINEGIVRNLTCNIGCDRKLKRPRKKHRKCEEKKNN